MEVLCYSKCNTCRKALKYLEDHGVDFDARDIKEENPSAQELREWIGKSGLPSRKFFNTSGKLYKEMELSKKLPDMPEEDQIRLLASDGMLVKRPLLINGDRVLVGFKETEWEDLLSK